MTGCSSKGFADNAEESYFITENIDSTTDGGYVIITEYDWEPIAVAQTLCPGIHGISSVRAYNPSGEVVVTYTDGDSKTFLFDDEAIDIGYITKTHDSNSPCIIRSDHCVYVYNADTADFSIIADDFLFYLESYQDRYYYVNTAHNLVDSEGIVYCSNVIGVRADSNPNNTLVYVSNE